MPKKNLHIIYPENEIMDDILSFRCKREESVPKHFFGWPGDGPEAKHHTWPVFNVDNLVEPKVGDIEEVTRLRNEANYG